MRRALAGVIVAHHHDIRILEAEDWLAAQAQIDASHQPCHLVVYNWDLVSDDWREAARFTADREIPLLVVGPEPGSSSFHLLVDGGLEREQIVPCRREAVVGAIDRLCDPLGLRREQRYIIPGTIARLEQERTTYFGVVIDISRTGMLCDVEYVPAFRWDREMSIRIEFPGATPRTAEGIRGRVRRLAVIEENPDLSPLIVRLALAFSEVPPAAADVFDAVFAEAEAALPLD